MERMVGYLQQKENHHLVLRRPRELRPVGSADSNYATDSDDRRSVTGNVNTLGGMITSWTSKKQPITTLSSTEAEYVSVATHCQETIFLQMLLDEITTSVRPAVIYEDNMGCIYLVRNQQVGARTKHIDVRHHFIREQVAKGNIKVCFIPTEENESDACTKNLPEVSFTKHAGALINGTLRHWIGEGVEKDIRDSRLTSDANDSHVTEPIVVNPSGTKKGTRNSSPAVDSEGWVEVSKRRSKTGFEPT
jgi:hypothetical protein